MSNELMSKQSFQERMTERLREDVGKLIPDEKLAEMVEQAMQSMFFTKRVERNSWGRETAHPSWWEDEVEKSMRERVHKFTQTYLEERSEDLEKVILETIQQNLHHWLAAAMVRVFTTSAGNISFEVVNGLETRLREHGVTACAR